MKNKKQNEELQNRREFFKNAAKKALPIIGAIVLASNPLFAHARSVETLDCNRTCSGGCLNGCFGCSGSCRERCANNCHGTCTGSCSTSCHTSSSNGSRRRPSTAR